MKGKPARASIHPKTHFALPRNSQPSCVAAASLHSNLLLGAFSTRLRTERLAEHFRWFRWNIRREPFADRNLTRIEESLNLKLSITDSPGFLVYLKAGPTALSEILTSTHMLRI